MPHLRVRRSVGWWYGGVATTSPTTSEGDRRRIATRSGARATPPTTNASAATSRPTTGSSAPSDITDGRRATGVVQGDASAGDQAVGFVGSDAGGTFGLVEACPLSASRISRSSVTSSLTFSSSALAALSSKRARSWSYFCFGTTKMK